MKIEGAAALVTGAGSGLGAATARALAQRGARVALLDVNVEAAARVAQAIVDAGGTAVALACDVTREDSVLAAVEAAAAVHGGARILMHVAGIGSARRIVGKDGQPAPLADFERVVRVNLIGTYNMARIAAAAMLKLEPLQDNERGVIVNTASVAAFDGQIGQEAYAASKGGVAAMTLPLARDLAQFGVRAVTIAPGLFHTPLMDELPQAVQESLAASIPFPRRLGKPEEFAQLALSIVENSALNGEVIRLDGALRMAPR
ncbi:MAG: SDR family NAD(P)-dependent oxidoreductase [Sphaerotilus natans subsp. sulfidivorans]|uniref:SDR family NAD(P)-dependent oxidoreductase n=1 Tax=Sphaerotilus sulfidivorans TaxID=639200 RepID=UPI0023579AFE|nr:SDR family NAD(P)-dependent oxidoreductase [Sphaerotilus sulfidivorans]MCK6401333.1 SDR family NAD(P)-dependent oxidoreductase [Sphaerotilus sulfidivorans]